MSICTPWKVGITNLDTYTRRRITFDKSLTYIGLILVGINRIVFWIILLQPKLVEQVVHFLPLQFTAFIDIRSFKESVSCFLWNLKSSHHRLQLFQPNSTISVFVQNIKIRIS